MLFQQAVHPAEQLLVGALFGGGVGQVAAGAGRPCVGQKQLCAELLLQPAVEALVPLCSGLKDCRRIRQQGIAVSAAAVDQVGAGNTASRQQLVQIMLHEQFQEERPAAQGTQGVFGVDGVEELLDTGKIGRVEQEGVRLPELGFLLKQCFVQVGDAVCLRICTDAGSNCGSGLGMVKQGNIRAFAGKSAGRKAAELRFQQAQQRVDPFRLWLQIRQALFQLAHGICIDGSRERMLLLRKFQAAVLRLGRHHPAGV